MVVGTEGQVCGKGTRHTYLGNSIKPLQCGYFGLNWSFGTLSGKDDTFKVGLDIALQNLKKILYFVCVVSVVWTFMFLRWCQQVPCHWKHWCLWNVQGLPLAMEGFSSNLYSRLSCDLLKLAVSMLYHVFVQSCCQHLWGGSALFLECWVSTVPWGSHKNFTEVKE